MLYKINRYIRRQILKIVTGFGHQLIAKMSTILEIKFLLWQKLYFHYVGLPFVFTKWPVEDETKKVEDHCVRWQQMAALLRQMHRRNKNASVVNNKLPSLLHPFFPGCRFVNIAGSGDES
jgi:hypothetical protein